MYENGKSGCGSGTTLPVGSKAAGNTAQGLSDMVGNVWQWVADFWAGQYQPETVRNPKGLAAGSHRVVCGGSFKDGAGDLRANLRSSAGFPGYRFDVVGFRPVRPSAR